jgi:Spy/CpxP family protein refolding chaperone
MKYGVIFVAGAGCAALAAFAWPQAAPPSRAHGIAAHYAELELTEEQRPRVDALVADLERRVGPLCRTIGERKRELYEELRKEQPDTVRIDASIESAMAARREMQRALVEHLVAVKPVLSAEQRGRLFDRLAAAKR